MLDVQRAIAVHNPTYQQLPRSMDLRGLKPCTLLEVQNGPLEGHSAGRYPQSISDTKGGIPNHRRVAMDIGNTSKMRVQNQLRKGSLLDP